MRRSVAVTLSGVLLLPGLLGGVAHAAPADEKQEVTTVDEQASSAPVEEAVPAEDPKASESEKASPVEITEEVKDMQVSNKVIASPVQTNQLNQMMKEAKITKEQAVEIAKQFVNIPAGYKQESVNFQTNWYPDNRNVWYVYWSKQEERSYGSINVTVDADTGEVLGMNRYENNPDQVSSYPPKVDKTKASTIALDFIKKQFPKQAGQVELDKYNLQFQKPPLKGDVNYYVRFVRMVNGVSFDDNYISVNVNGNGEIVGMDYRWNERLNFPSTDGMMPQDEAEKKITASIPLALQYQTIYGMAKPYGGSEENQPKIVLTYNNTTNYPFMDAKTGRWLSSNGSAMSQDGMAAVQPLSDKPLAEPPSPRDKELTQKEALSAIRQVVNIPGDAVLQNVSYNENWGNGRQSVWNFNWNIEGKDFYIYAAVDAKTGEILNYSQENPRLYKEPDDQFKQKVTYNEAKNKAIAAAKKLVPSKVNQLVFNPSQNMQPPNPEKMREFNFNFQRIVNGVAVSDQTVNIGVSSETGEVTRFYQNWNDQVKFPDPKDAIPLDKAKEIYLNNFDIAAQYVLAHQDYYGPYPMPRASQQEPKVMLVYSLRNKPMDEPVYLDATKGKWISSNTGEAVTEEQEPTDISGHWAEKPLRLMLEYHAIDLDEQGRVQPDQEITRGEMVKMLMLTTNPDPYFYKMRYAASERAATFNDVKADSPYFAYVESAAQQGLIDKSKKEFRPNDLVTREEMADLIVRAMRYDKLAQVDGLFNLDFKDADQIKLKGAVAIVSKLGIMKGSDGYFKPEGNVSRAEAAATYYEFLQKRAQFEQGPPYYY